MGIVEDLPMTARIEPLLTTFWSDWFSAQWSFGHSVAKPPRETWLRDSRWPCHEPVCHKPRRKGVDRLVHQVDGLLVNWPGPWWTPDSSRILQRLIVDKAQVEEHEGTDRASQATLGHCSACPAKEDALPQCIAQFSASRSRSGRSGSLKSRSSVWAGT
jgi:hypothetical protein